MTYSTKLALPAFVPTYDFLMGYDYIIVCMSGGKDSVACVLTLLAMGIPPEKIELHHHLVDGDGPTFMDWPITPAYCQAVANLIGVRMVFSYREGGFYREMMRDNVPTAPTQWQDIDGNWHKGGGVNYRTARRLRFPDITKLRNRWCHPYLKTLVMESLLANDLRFRNRQTLVVSGERIAEGLSRAVYQFEAHTADNRLDPDRDPLKPMQRYIRHIDHWRPLFTFQEDQVWDLIREAGIIPHPAYRLGFSRCDCRVCVLSGANHWATIRYLYPDRFQSMCAQEAAFGVKIRETMPLDRLVRYGRPFPAAVAQPELAAFANQTTWSGPVYTDDWQMPAGAFGDKSGPC